MSEILLIPASEYHSLKKEVMSIKDILSEVLCQLKKEDEDYLSTEEVCRMFKISKPSLYRRRSEGMINAMQSGRVVRWPLSECKKLFKSR